VLLTGYAGDSTTLAVDGAISGAFSLLRKPIRIHELDDRIRALLTTGRTIA
jgi:DNA-binding response OmpR family regulator